MRTIVTGASGCIGRALLRNMPEGSGEIYALYNKSADFESFLKTNGLDKVHPVKCDLTDPAAVGHVFKNADFFDNCVYLASNIDVARSADDPLYDLNVNAAGLINFLSRVRIKRLIYMSSTSVYDGLKGPVGPGSCLEPLVPYGISKLACEQYVKFFARKRKYVEEYAIFRLSGAYGPYSPAKKIYNRIIRDFYFDAKDAITLFGDGKNLIDLLHVDEVAAALRLAAGSKQVNYTVDLSSGNAMKLNDLVTLGGAIFGKKKIRIDHTVFPDTEKYMTYSVSQDGARKAIGFINKVGYEEGLTKLAEFYKSKGWEKCLKA